MIPNVICPDKPPKGAFYAMPDLGYYVNKLRHSKGDPTLGVAQLCSDDTTTICPYYYTTLL